MKEGAGGERRGIEREGGGGGNENTCLQYETYICS